MKMLRNLALVLIGIVAASLLWRRLSRRFSIPCPTLLAGFLEMEGDWADRIFRTEETLDRIGLEPGQRVLEIGPGPGRLLIPAAKRVRPGGEVIGLDIQPGMLARLATRAESAGVQNLTTVLGDATQPHFAPSSLDVIYLVTVLGEIPDREATLYECLAALKPGGHLSITEIFPDPHYQSRGTVQSLAESAGFSFQALYGVWYFYTINFVRP